MKRVFISYSRKQKSFTERLARDLSDAGIDVWIDFRQIEGGERWRDEIFKGLEKSEGVVFALSPDAVRSEWCRREVSTARAQNKPVYPIVVMPALDLLDDFEETAWLVDVQYISFEERYEQGITELITALSGKRDPYDDIDLEKIPNPFKGLEAFQQTDAHIFFGREDLVRKLLDHLKQEIESRSTRFLAVVGASGSGKSSLVRAGLIPSLRAGSLPGSDKFPIAIVTPGASPIESLSARLLPLLPNTATMDEVYDLLNRNPQSLNLLAEKILANTADATYMLLVIDQFEEIFTRASENERERFIKLLHTTATTANGRTLTVITMRADFFGSLSKYLLLAELFEHENMVIATEMTPTNLRRSIEGPAGAVGLLYDAGLVDRILEDVRQQPGSLPLLQYALKELYQRRAGRVLTAQAYDEIGGVQRALAQHADDIYASLNSAQQDIMRRVLLRLVEVNDSGEATRRKIARQDLTFRGISDEAVQDVVDLLTAAESRLLIASREIPKKEQGEQEQPTTWLEVSHEALINQWSRFQEWVSADAEALRYGGEILKAARDWQRANRDNAYLLTGNRLTRAEGWMETADANPLQRAFVQASVQERERLEATQIEQQQRELELQTRLAGRLRAFVIALAIFSIIAIALLGLVGYFLTEAQRQRDEAERQSLQARSLALAANALRVSGDNESDLSLSLALTANEINTPPVEAQRALAELAYLPGTRFLLNGHSGAVTSMSVSADGVLALSGSEDHTLILWDTTTGTALLRLGTPVTNSSALSSILVNPDAVRTTQSGHTNRVTSVALSADGTRALSAGADNFIIYWDLTTGEELARATVTSPIRSIVFHPNGQMAAFGNAQGNIFMRSLDALSQNARTMPTNSGAVLSLAFNADGSQLLCGTLRNTMILWDTATGDELRRFVGHTQPINDVVFSVDNSLVLSGSNDNTVRLWDAATGAELAQFESDEPQPVFSVAFNPEGTRVLSANKSGVITVWDIDSGTAVQRLFGHEGAVNAIAYLRDDIAISAGADYTLRILDTEGDEIMQRTHTHDEIVNSLAVSPDGTLLLTGSDDGTLALLDSNTGGVLRRFEGHTDAVNAVVFSPDGTRIVSASRDATVRVWEVASGAVLLTFTEHTDEVFTAAYSPDGTRLLSGDGTGTLLLWDAASGARLLTLSSPNGTGHADTVYSAVFSPDGTQALSADGAGVIILWDAATGAEVRRFGITDEDERHNGRINSVAFSPDGTQALSGGDDFTMILWDVATGHSIRRFLEQGNRVKSVMFSPDGNIALSGALDGTVRLWDIETGTEIRRYGGGIGSPRIYSVVFSPTAHQVISGDTEGNVTQWRVFTVASELVAWTLENRFVPALTQDQCDLFRVAPPCP
jgi:WD40 repeat protein